MREIPNLRTPPNEPIFQYVLLDAPLQLFSCLWCIRLRFSYIWSLSSARVRTRNTGNQLTDIKSTKILIGLTKKLRFFFRAAVVGGSPASRQRHLLASGEAQPSPRLPWGRQTADGSRNHPEEPGRQLLRLQGQVHARHWTGGYRFQVFWTS